MPPNTEAEESRIAKILWRLGSALAGGAGVLIIMTLWIASVKTEAHEAKGDAANVKADIDCIVPRINTLEKHEAEDRKDAEGRYRMLEEVRGDVKEILKRLPR